MLRTVSDESHYERNQHCEFDHKPDKIWVRQLFKEAESKASSNDFDSS